MLAFLLFLHVIFIIWGSNTIKIIGKVILLRSVIYTLDLKHSTNVQHKCDASLKFEVQLPYISFMTIFRTFIYLPALCFTLACELHLLCRRFSVQLTDDTFWEHLLFHSGAAIQSDVNSFFSTYKRIENCDLLMKPSSITKRFVYNLNKNELFPSNVSHYR